MSFIQTVGLVDWFYGDKEGWFAFDNRGILRLSCSVNIYHVETITTHYTSQHSNLKDVGFRAVLF
jgi:hypothetical protein